MMYTGVMGQKCANTLVSLLNIHSQFTHTLYLTEEDKNSITGDYHTTLQFLAIRATITHNNQENTPSHL